MQMYFSKQKAEERKKEKRSAVSFNSNNTKKYPHDDCGRVATCRIDNDEAWNVVVDDDAQTDDG